MSIADRLMVLAHEQDKMTPAERQAFDQFLIGSLCARVSSKEWLGALDSASANARRWERARQLQNTKSRQA